ncbi:hypothetical protein [Rahnella sikkimica]|uniref:DUF551 domain-containing protein n=1 Tax=Rahnella sikkimica TaxID=1805933 RepID=A0A2L1UMW0_9GAMM|nr:hypothetical protein [Rahnella sikkimica]AVF34264.1 hypothetical protein BV494_04645 [Rahnella sikkimica]
MNNDLEQFSEERLEDMQKYVTAGMTLGHADALLIRQAIGIALAAKRAKPVGYSIRDENYNWHIDFCGKAHELQQGDSLYTTPPANSPAIPDGWIKYQAQRPAANEYISFVSRHGEYASGLVGEDEWVEMHDGTSFELAEIYIWLLLPPLPAAPKPESDE